MGLHCNKLQKLLVSHEGMGNGHVVPLENGAGPSNGILTLSRPKCAIVVQQWHPTNMLNAVHSILLLSSLDNRYGTSQKLNLLKIFLSLAFS